MMTDKSPSEDELLEQLDPFEPYTTAELCEQLDTEPGRLRSLLEKLSRKGKIRKKKPRSSPTIWIREPPAQACTHCGREFEIKFLHPVLSAVRFCPRCGHQL